MYIRIAQKNPVEDYSVPGWAPNSIIIENTTAFQQNKDAETIIAELEERGLVVEFTAEDLEKAIENNADELPQIHFGAVATFEAPSIEDWLSEYYNDLERMGYFSDGQLLEDMRIWEVKGQVKEVDDMEGVYIIAEDAVDITEKVSACLKKF